MKNCTKCGALIEDNANFCPNCAAPQNGEPAQHKNGGMMVWSVITMIFCGFIFGLFGVINTGKANKAVTRAEEEEFLKKAKIWNIVGNILGVISLIGNLA